MAPLRRSITGDELAELRTAASVGPSSSRVHSLRATRAQPQDPGWRLSAIESWESQAEALHHFVVRDSGLGAVNDALESRANLGGPGTFNDARLLVGTIRLDIQVVGKLQLFFARELARLL